MERSRLSPPLGEKGFSLMELILVVALMAVIMAGLAAFEGTLLRQKGLAIQEVTVQGQADLTRKKILGELSEATTIVSPVVGVGSNELYGYKNVDPADNTKVWGPDANKRHFRFCVNAGPPPVMYAYWGKGDVPAVACGTPNPLPNTFTATLAGGPTSRFQAVNIPGTSFFNRTRNNYIEVKVRVYFDPTKDASKMSAVPVYADVNTGVSLPLATQ
ncbi:MAG: prepilin-type N-terminal cleavage/methylation domain-containing protein [Elusimicrobia bacterium]|nr:prepilin-type N-terminal cleavage/methylation domain-containing protein [Elusimicrobiota bacterium]